jgi:hypothetical protein
MPSTPDRRWTRFWSPARPRPTILRAEQLYEIYLKERAEEEKGR